MQKKNGNSGVLAAALKEAGIPVDAGALQAIFAGMAAAPEAVRKDTWMTMLGEPLSPKSQGILQQFYEEWVVRQRREVKSEPAQSASRLTALRATLAREGLDGFIVPRMDAYQGENIPLKNERLLWLTGFSGSAGIAVVLKDQAAIFVDGRYSLQVRQQTRAELFTPHHVTEFPPYRWVEDNLPSGGRLGFDPWLHSADEVTRWQKAVAKVNGELVPVTGNPIDTIWQDQPPMPISPAVGQDIQYAGEASSEKITRLAEELKKQAVDASILTAPESIAWLLNMRGGDVPHTPLPLSFAILHASATVDLFIDSRKVTPALRRHLGNAVSLHEEVEFLAALDALAKVKKIVLLDKSHTVHAITARLEAAGANIRPGQDLCVLPRACKNAVEIAGMTEAHIRDGVAIVRFLHWLEETIRSETVTEIGASARLAQFRREVSGDLFRGLSFDTISGAGPNGAIVHYRATPSSNRSLQLGELYLIDSGGQYPDGTTDITRTLALGSVIDPEPKDRFTRVLKGHIALARVCFPRGTTGSQLDTLARQSLWQAGLDYDHGTGHGVGCYLGVHEGPQRISKIPNLVPLVEGMVISNEPGYYKAGAYGIRIENLVTVIKRDVPGAEREMLGFRTLTLAPIDRSLIAQEHLTAEETAWLNQYHQAVYEQLAPHLTHDVRNWLAKATAAL